MKIGKIVASVLFLGCAMNAVAATVVVTSKDTDASGEVNELAKVPQTLIGIMRDSGLRFRAIGGSESKYRIEAKKINCFQRNNGGLDSSSPLADITLLACRINSDEIFGSALGTKFPEARALEGILDQVESKFGADAAYGDCAMGKCAILVKDISCDVDVNSERDTDRFVCALTSYESK